MKPVGSGTSQSELGERLAQRWVSFGRLLRRNGVAVTAGQVRDLLRALPLLDIGDRGAVYFAARAMLCSRKEDLPKFDLVFRQFWGRTRQVIIPSDTGSIGEQAGAPGGDIPAEGDRRRGSRVLPPVERVSMVDLGDSGAGSGAADMANEELPQRLLLYSAEERLKHLDFARFSEEELATARSLMAAWQWRPSLRRTRRLMPARRGRRLDVTRTLRLALRTEGVPYHLALKGPRHKPRPLVVLCDISGSMAPYTRMLLHFLHTLRRRMSHTEVFLFGTRITRITRRLRVRDVDQALEGIGKSVSDWSGGTRTGEALRTFNTVWARRVLGQGAIVCIISDGWDRGDPGLLAGEMARLQRMAFRLIWLNPLLGVKGYQPLTRGMAIAVQYVDYFLPAHDLASLQSLAGLLSRLDANTRPERKQAPAAPAPTGREPSPAVAPRFTVGIQREA